MAKTIDDYLRLPYTIELIPNPGGGYAVAVKELPGCISQGETAEEAIEMIRDAMAGWIEIALEDGLPIPEPRPEESYSGKFVVRLPKSLHRRLVERSETEGVSLNQYINSALALALGEAVSEEKATYAVHERQDAYAVSSWPGLSENAAAVLRMAGLQSEANQADERLFAAWLESVHNSVERACANEFWQEAIRTLQQADAILDQNGAHSPFIRSLAAMLEFQIYLIEKTVRMERAVVHQAIQPQIQDRIREVNQPVSQTSERSKEVIHSLLNVRSISSWKTETSHDLFGEFLKHTRDE